MDSFLHSNGFEKNKEKKLDGMCVCFFFFTFNVFSLYQRMIKVKFNHKSLLMRERKHL